MDDKHWPLLISLKEDKKRDIFQNLNKIRESEVPFHKINIAHDLTKNKKNRKKSCKKKLEEQEKEETDQSGEWMYHVHHGIGSSKEFPKEHFERNPEEKVK